MGRLLPRSRPRKRSVDFSRLWWLVETEASFQVRLWVERRAALFPISREQWGRSLNGLTHRRAWARAILDQREVIV